MPGSFILLYFISFTGDGITTHADIGEYGVAAQANTGKYALESRQMPSIRALKGPGMTSKELRTQRAVPITSNLAVPMPQASKTAAKKPDGPHYREGEVLVGFKKGIKAQAIDEMLSTKKVNKKKKFPVLSRLKGNVIVFVIRIHFTWGKSIESISTFVKTNIQRIFSRR